MSQVLPWLYLGSQEAAGDEELLRHHRISPRDETHHPPLLTRLGSTGLVKKANVVGENELVNEYLLCKLCREYIIFHDKTQ